MSVWREHTDEMTHVYGDLLCDAYHGTESLVFELHEVLADPSTREAFAIVSELGKASRDFVAVQAKVQAIVAAGA